MRRKTKSHVAKLTTIASCVVALLNIPTSPIEAAGNLAGNFGSGSMAIKKNNFNNATNFINGKNNAPLAIQFSAGENVSSAVAKQFSASFGIQNPTTDLKVFKSFMRNDKGQNIRYQQYYNGLPVIGGQLVANTNKNNQLLSMSGETSPYLNLATKATITAKQAEEIALEAIARLHKIDDDLLKASKPKLSIYDPKLISPSVFPASLVWQIEVTPTELQPIREFVVVDAQHGGILMHFNQVDTLLDRVTFTADNTFTLPGTFVCSEVDPTCAAGDADAKAAHQYAGDTYTFFLKHHGRDSLDGLGMSLISTVHFGPPDFINAFWDGTQMAYGNGMSLADDVVAHELTHGVTENTSNLFYVYQSGAINESLSDVWSEFVDQTNGRGSDTPSDRWQLGEDLVNFGIMPNIIRDMSDPTSTIRPQPDRITSVLYYKGLGDSGGVHVNSGVNNKAAYLMTDGGAFNGQDVKALGYEKVAKIYYEVQTNYLTQGSTYLDLYNALNQGCINLIGTTRITSADCLQVRAATDAVEMNKQPAKGYNPQAQICEPGKTANIIFEDGFENGSANWDLPGTGFDKWQVVDFYVGSGKSALFAPNISYTGDTIAAMNKDVFLPKDAKTYLHFKHVFEFSNMGWGGLNDDGGVLEYSIDAGATWSDAGKYIDTGRKYNGQIASGTSNPIAGQNGFVTISNGYNSTRLNLESLKGQPIRFRWRIGTDSMVGNSGWILDEVKLYSCK